MTEETKPQKRLSDKDARELIKSIEEVEREEAQESRKQDGSAEADPD